MKKISTTCSDICPSYTKKPDAGFYSKTIKAGETFVFEAGEYNNLVFLTAGEFIINSVEREKYNVPTMSFVFCYKAYRYEITAITDVELVISYFMSMIYACDMLSLQKVNTDINKIRYKFKAVEINKPLNYFLSSLLYYLKSDIYCLHMHRAKSKELFIIFKFFYTVDLQMTTFYNLFDRNILFMSLVINNRRKAKNVEELARLCGYSISRFKAKFKALFEDTPYAWMQKQNALEIHKKLCDLNYPLKKIVYTFGFTDYSHLSRYCKKHFGSTPSQLRTNTTHEDSYKIGSDHNLI